MPQISAVSLTWLSLSSFARCDNKLAVACSYSFASFGMWISVVIIIIIDAIIMIIVHFAQPAWKMILFFFLFWPCCFNSRHHLFSLSSFPCYRPMRETKCFSSPIYWLNQLLPFLQSIPYIAPSHNPTPWVASWHWNRLFFQFHI